MPRAGMTRLLTEVRRMVDDIGKAVWTDDELEETLDQRRTTVTFLRLEDVAWFVDGDTVTFDYEIPAKERGHWEGATSGTAAWRMYDSSGALVGTATYTVNYQAGVITFAADQEGSARYLDGRRYDLNGAAAELWNERAAGLADAYDFRDPSGAYKRSQWYEHCLKQARRYKARSEGGVRVMQIERDDYA